jgi:hypothetical protein
MTTTDRFLGTWVLVPELCLYEGRRWPAEGGMVIETAGEGRIAVTVRFRIVDEDAWQEASVAGPADGSAQTVALAAPVPGAPDRFTLTRVDEGTLDSATFVGDHEIAKVRRVASADGALLAVVNEARMATGSRVRNFQVYRRLAR